MKDDDVRWGPAVLRTRIVAHGEGVRVREAGNEDTSFALADGFSFC